MFLGDSIPDIRAQRIYIRPKAVINPAAKKYEKKILKHSWQLWGGGGR
jgi:hypothetical protein